MIERIRFKNFKALKDAELKLGPFNLIVGPNGSGKTSLLQGLEFLADAGRFSSRPLITNGTDAAEFSVDALWNSGGSPEWGGYKMSRPTSGGQSYGPRLLAGEQQVPLHKELLESMERCFKGIRVFALNPETLSQPTPADEVGELHRSGKNLAGALQFIRDQDEDAYAQLREDLNQWLPEFDAIRFITEKGDFNEKGKKRLSLRQIRSNHYVEAAELSEGTLMALALLTITHQPGAPTIVALEEPDRALHPRLLREVRDSLYRLAFPTDYGLKRKPVQVIATTHSPYFLDLFRDHPEQIIVAEKKSDGTATFRSLSDHPHLREIIGDAPLGEVWYSGVLGGVPVAM